MTTPSSRSLQAGASPEHPDMPGWYQHPADSSWDMYWDGRRWTRSRPHGVHLERSPGRVTALYLSVCILPFIAAILLPWPVFMAVSPDSGVGSADAWRTATGAAILTGWALWVAGVAGWMLGASLFKGDRPQSPEPVRRWHRTGRGWAIGVAVWGVLASAAMMLVLLMGLALGGVANSL